MIRVGVIGCGAAAERLHLPAIAHLPEVEATWIVDAQLDRAKAVAQQYDVFNVTDDYTQVADIDAVLIATPPYLHAPMSEFFLAQEVHVLCEKPFTIRTADAERLVALAQERNLVLAVGVFRRYYPVSAFFRHVIETDWLGPVERVDAEEGSQYDWGPQSTFRVERDKAGGGVLIDTGSHTIDRILWWFDTPKISLESYCDDNSYDGLEADCEVRFSIQWRDRSIPVRVELSRTRNLRNTFQVFTSHGMIESPANVPNKAWFSDRRLGLTYASSPIFLDIGEQSGETGRRILSYFQDQLGDFCAAIGTGKEPLNAAQSIVPLVRLIESCYSNRQAIPQPWVAFGMDHVLLNTEEMLK
jgi:predicted dehydrogenase